MENPATWKPIHHAIKDILHENQDSEMLPYELIAKLQDQNFLPKSDLGDLVEIFEEAIWKHQDGIEKGICGISLPMRLGKLVESLGD